MEETPVDQHETHTLETQIVEQLRTCFDPEIPVNIYDLGLIYAITVTPAGAAHVTMTLTSPACPVAGSLPGEVKTKVAESPGVTDVQVDVVWDPPWDPSKMSEDARLELGLL
jgi:FeS assembly SUF system protein